MNSFQKLDKDKIEKEAAKRFNAIKFKDNVYAIPEYVVKSTRLEKEDILNIDKEIIENIDEIKVDNGDILMVLLKERVSKTIKIINLNNHEIQEFIYHKEINDITRKEIVNSIAYKYKHKEIIVSFYISYSLDAINILLQNTKTFSDINK